MENMPRLVQHMPSLEQINNDSGMDLILYQCDGCGLVQFDCEAVFYYKDVIRAGGFSEELKKLRHGQFKYLIDKYDLANKSVWEIGCGKGEFLELLQEYPVKAYGIENNKELVDAGKKAGINIECGFAGDNFVDNRGPFDAFISFNYLEHQPNPSDMVQCICSNLKPNGIGLITVPSFEYFIEKASYYEFMRDHIAYYTEQTLSLLFELNGFEIMEVSRFNGDTTQIIVKKRETIKLPDFDAQKMCIQDFINNYINQNELKTGKVAVWGASHQGLTMLATLKLKANIQYIVDSATFKQGSYSPVSHHKIVSPDVLFNDNIDMVIIMAPAFSDEIAMKIMEKAPSIKHILAVKDDKVLVKKGPR